MPRLRKPESSIDRLAFFRKVVSTAESSGEKSLISNESKEKAKELVPKLATGLGNIVEEKTSAGKEKGEKNSSLKVLETYIRDIWIVFKRRVYREALDPVAFTFYQLPRSGNVPNLKSEGHILETAELIIKGEAAAIKAGYQPMANPSIEELKEKLENARSEIKDVSEADLKLNAAEEAVSGLTPESAALVDRIIAELNFNLFDKVDADKRRIMRNYGVKYEITMNEQKEDESDLSLDTIEKV